MNIWLIAAWTAAGSCLAAQSPEEWRVLDGDRETHNIRLRGETPWVEFWSRHCAECADPRPRIDFSREIVLIEFLGNEGASGFTPKGANPPFFMRTMPKPAVSVPQEDGKRAEDGGKAFPAKTPDFVGRAGLSGELDSGRLGCVYDGSRGAARVDSSGPGGHLGGEWYFSWGYNKEWWAPTDIHIRSPSLGNDFTIHRVRGHDEPGWTTGILNKPPTNPQYNIRIGRFIDEKRSLAVELNFDHTKYTSTLDQTARISGTLGGRRVDQQTLLDRETFRYDLHNGANSLMVNVVKRLPLIGEPNRSLSVSGIAKAGAGLLIPHASNHVLGKDNDVGPREFGNWFGKHKGWWQFDGWTAGVEAGFRFVPLNPLFIEVTDKVAYGRLSDVPVYKGTADHDLLMHELILSIGLTIDGG